MLTISFQVPVSSLGTDKANYGTFGTLFFPMTFHDDQNKTGRFVLVENRPLRRSDGQATRRICPFGKGRAATLATKANI